MMKTNFITATAVRSLLHGFYTYKTNKLGEADFIKDGPKYHIIQKALIIFILKLYNIFMIGRKRPELIIL